MRDHDFREKKQTQRRGGKGPRASLKPEKSLSKPPAGGRKSVKNQIRSYQRLLNKVGNIHHSVAHYCPNTFATALFSQCKLRSESGGSGNLYGD